MAYFDGSPWWAGSDGVSDPILLHITLSYIYHITLHKLRHSLHGRHMEQILTWLTSLLVMCIYTIPCSCFLPVHWPLVRSNQPIKLKAQLVQCVCSEAMIIFAFQCFSFCDMEDQTSNTEGGSLHFYIEQEEKTVAVHCNALSCIVSKSNAVLLCFYSVLVCSELVFQ